MNSLELVEKRLREIDQKLTLLLKNQLVFYRTLILLIFNEAPLELKVLLKRLESQIETYEKALKEA